MSRNISSFEREIRVWCFFQWDDNQVCIWETLPYLKNKALSKSDLDNPALQKCVIIQTKEISEDLWSRVSGWKAIFSSLVKAISKELKLHQSTVDCALTENIEHHCCTTQEWSTNKDHTKIKTSSLRSHKKPQGSVWGPKSLSCSDYYQCSWVDHQENIEQQWCARHSCKREDTTLQNEPMRPK